MPSSTTHWSCTLADLARALQTLSRLRSEAMGPRALAGLEEAFDALFGASQRLIVYGSLAPGGANHEQLGKVEGDWQVGWVTGRLMHRGWAAAEGYPVLQWSPSGERVPAHLFTSRDLPSYWRRLDEFEGEDYRRILVPFFDEGGLVAVGNLYGVASDTA